MPKNVIIKSTLIYSYGTNNYNDSSSCTETDSAPDVPNILLLTGGKRKDQRKILKQITSSSELSHESIVFSGGNTRKEPTGPETQFSFDGHDDQPIAGNLAGIGNVKEFSIPETQQFSTPQEASDK